MTHEPAIERLIEVQEQNSAFENRLETFSIVDFGHIEIRNFLIDSFMLFETWIRQVVDEHRIIKVAAKRKSNRLTNLLHQTVCSD